MRKLTGPIGYIAKGLGVAVALFTLYTAVAGVYTPFVQRGVHLMLVLPLVFLLYPATKNSSKEHPSVLDIFLSALAILPSLYVVINRKMLDARMPNVSGVSTLEMVLGIIALILVIEAVRRAVAPVMAGLVTVFFLYLPFGHLLPGILYHSKYTFKRIVESIYLMSTDGIYGSLMGTAATQIALFILFGSFAVQMGAGEFFTDFARALAGGARGGPAKIATLSSCLFGTLSGSSVANVYATGTFTIPLMKKNGFQSNFAGAVEAAASTGGQLMPPIMGAAAFLLADNLGIPYIKVAIYALIPALLYYIAIWFMIDARCNRDGVQGENKEDLPKMANVMRNAHTFIPVVILFTLLCCGFSVLFSGFFSICACIVLSYFRKDTRMTPKRILAALYSGAFNAAMVSSALAGAGIIVVALTKTGLALTLGSMIVGLARGYLLPALIFIGVVTIILGMGVPTTPAYVIAAAVGSTALVRLGVLPLAAHLFVLYYAVISNITPPVAIAAYAGANIAKGDPMKTGVEAFKLALSGFIVPFIFAFNPLLLMQGSTVEVLLASASSLLGVFMLSGGLQGWFFGNAKVWMRVLLVCGSLMLIIPGTATDLAGLAVGVILFIIQKAGKKRLSGAN